MDFLKSKGTPLTDYKKMQEANSRLRQQQQQKKRSAPSSTQRSKKLKKDRVDKMDVDPAPITSNSKSLTKITIPRSKMFYGKVQRNGSSEIIWGLPRERT